MHFYAIGKLPDTSSSSKKQQIKPPDKVISTKLSINPVFLTKNPLT